MGRSGGDPKITDYGHFIKRRLIIRCNVGGEDRIAARKLKKFMNIIGTIEEIKENPEKQEMEDKSFSIQSIINNFLQKEMEERKEHKSEYFHASSLGTCRRKQIWKRMGEPETNPPDDRTLRIFSVGNIFHEWIQEKLGEAGVLLKKEETIINEEYNYKGRYDALVAQDGIRLLYDFKTQNSRSFWYMEDKGIDDAKKLQVVSYVVMGNIPVSECRVLMISRDDMCVREFPVKVDEWKDKVIEELIALNKLFKNKELPEKLPENFKDIWQCSYCSYLLKCRGNNWKKPSKIKVNKK